MTTIEILNTLLDRFAADALSLANQRGIQAWDADTMAAYRTCKPRYNWPIHGVSVGLLDTQRALTNDLRQDGPINLQSLCDWLSLWNFCLREHAAEMAFEETP